jgi:uncharacterized protein YbaR (Trm112 family)
LYYRCLDRASKEKDISVWKQFTEIYCRTKHREVEKKRYMDVLLCNECQKTLEYAVQRREQCHIHCYELEQRERIKEIMRHSGMYMILHGRLDLIFHYFF